MNQPRIRPWTIIADDLTGAADAAAGSAGPSAIVLDVSGRWPEAEVLAVNTETRYRPVSEAAAAVAHAARRSQELGRRTFKKIDSLLRGNPGAEIASVLSELSAGGRGLAVVAPAFPATGRTTVNGVVHVHGTVHSAGRFEGSVLHALAAAGLEAVLVRADLAGGAAAFAQQLETLLRQGVRAAVVDVETDEELELIARAAELVQAPVLLAGSGGLAHHLNERSPRTSQPLHFPRPSRVLAVVGSYSELARTQLRALVDAGTRQVVLRPEAPEAAQVQADLAEAIASWDVVLAPDPAAVVDKARAPLVAGALAAAAAAVAADCDVLVLTGGETARAVLDALGVTHMTVLGEIEPGVVLNELPGDLPLVVTKAGSFGDNGTLARTIEAIKKNTNEMSNS